MTVIDRDTTAYDENGAEIDPGTLCWVRTLEAAPTNWRNKQRVLAVFTGQVVHPWMLLLPDSRPFDNTQDPMRHGWRFSTNLTSDLMESLNLRRFDTTHRGWWSQRSDIQFIERALGYWCVEHQVFHAAETCPPGGMSDPVEFDWAAKVLRLERELSQARADVQQAVLQGQQNLEDFKVRCSDILGAEASSHDLCGEYDRIAEDAGLYPRMSDHDVEVEVTYRMTLTVRARSTDAAYELVQGKSTSSYYEPPCPFSDESDVEMGSAYSLEVNTVD